MGDDGKMRAIADQMVAQRVFEIVGLLRAQIALDEFAAEDVSDYFAGLMLHCWVSLRTQVSGVCAPALRRTNLILPNLVEQSFVADVE